MLKKKKISLIFSFFYHDVINILLIEITTFVEVASMKLLKKSVSF